jgi:membrane-associated protein
MTATLLSLLSFLLLYKYVALVIFVFLGSFLLPLPDNTLIMSVGAFSSQGYFNLWLSLAVCLITNVSADILGYYITWKFGEVAIEKLKLRKYKNYHRAEGYFDRYSGITIFLTRIFGPFGPLVNFISGLYRIPFKKFLFFDILGNVVDISGYLFVGYLLGDYWQDFTNQIGWVGWGVLIIAILCLFVWNRFKRKH